MFSVTLESDLNITVLCLSFGLVQCVLSNLLVYLQKINSFKSLVRLISMSHALIGIDTKLAKERMGAGSSSAFSHLFNFQDHRYLNHPRSRQICTANSVFESISYPSCIAHFSQASFINIFLSMSGEVPFLLVLLLDHICSWKAVAFSTPCLWAQLDATFRRKAQVENLFGLAKA